MNKRRNEKDSLGTVEVPADKYWGAQTQRSFENFPIGDEPMPLEVIRALGVVKLAAARTNLELGLLPDDFAAAIEAAAAEVVRGEFDEHFPLVTWQTGSGTQSNMNVNEVIARRANELIGGQPGRQKPIHPNDHVNLSQSSNDSFPTAMHVAAVTLARERTLPPLLELQTALQSKAEQYADVVKAGRTHCMDATPLRLGQELGTFANQVGEAFIRIEAALADLYFIAQGGTAVGTGLNTVEGFDEKIALHISAITNLPFQSAPDKFSALAAHAPVVAMSAALRGAAMALLKIANDIRLLASGPRCGLAELRLPANEPGSSIMPGKVNPTQCEALIQVCIEVFGNDAAIAFAGSQGQFQLNTCKPLMIFNLLRSLRLLGDATASFTRRCVVGLEADEARIGELLERNLMRVTALAPEIGYDRAAEIAKAAHRKGTSLREEVLASGVIDEATFDRLTDPAAMTRPAPQIGDDEAKS